MSSTDATVVTGGSSEAPAPSGAPAIPDVAIERELGRGGMGAVWLGRQTYLDRQVAVKALLAIADEGFAARFRREAKILAGLAHPHIVACHSAGIAPDGRPYLVMEFVDGPDLRRWVKEHGPLPCAAAARVAREVAEGLAHAAAQGIIHRDVKPENVLLSRRASAAADDPFPWTAKLADLGLARPAQAPKGSAANLTMSGQVLGTPATMAPEQFDDPDHVDQRADIYGLGCVLYHALTGSPAFTGNSFAEIVASKVTGPAPDPTRSGRPVSPAVARLCGRMLARDKAQRPQEYPGLIAELRACEGSVAAAGPRWGLYAGIAAVLVVAGVGVAVAAGGGKPAEAPPAVVAPAPVAAPVAPAPQPAPAPATALAPLAAPVHLFGHELIDRITDWEQGPPGRGWGPAEERQDVAANGRSGWIARPLPGLPISITAMVEMQEPWDSWMAGVRLSDGRFYALKVLNLGLGTLQSSPRLDLAAPADVRVSRELAQASGKLRLDISATALVAVAGGTPIGEIALPSPPQSLVLAADAKGFVTFVDPIATPR